jgi:hypothetical protein
MRALNVRRTVVVTTALLALLAVFVAAALASTTYATLTGGFARHDVGGAHTQSITTLNSGSGWWLEGFRYAGQDYYQSCSASCSTNAGSGYGIPASPVWCADGVGPYNVSCKYP